MSEDAKPHLRIVKDEPPPTAPPPPKNDAALRALRLRALEMTPAADDAVRLGVAGSVLEKGAEPGRLTEALSAWLAPHFEAIRAARFEGGLYGDFEDLRDAVLGMAERVSDDRVFSRASWCLDYQPGNEVAAVVVVPAPPPAEAVGAVAPVATAASAEAPASTVLLSAFVGAFVGFLTALLFRR